MRSSPPSFTYEANELIARTNTINHLFLGLFLSAVSGYMVIGKYEETRTFFVQNKLLGVFACFILSFSIIYSFIMYFDKSVKLVINKNGVWMPKDGQVSWEAMWYYYIKIVADKKKRKY